jgi:hypothetical protein
MGDAMFGMQKKVLLLYLINKAGFKVKRRTLFIYRARLMTSQVKPLIKKAPGDCNLVTYPCFSNDKVSYEVRKGPMGVDDGEAARLSVKFASDRNFLAPL